MMRFQDLENALRTNNTLSINNGQVHIGPDLLDKTLPAAALAPFYGAAGIEIVSAVAAAGSGPRKIVVGGKTSFPLLNAPTDVLATFELVGDPETLALTLR